MDLCNPNEVRQFLTSRGFRFSKSLGQNFLIDSSVPRRIAEMSGVDGSCGVLEIGPGIGALTSELSLRAGKVAAVELDKDLQTCHQGLYVIGDGSGVTHSLSHASASGVYVARRLSDTL